jgi:SAM-dependent methyltransferase
MAFEDVMGAMMRWTTAAETMGAVGAYCSLLESGDGAPEVVAALQAVLNAAGLGDLAELAPQQRATIAAMAALYLWQSVDLLENAAAAPGWAYTDPTILDGWGRMSMMVPSAIAAAHGDLKNVESFLDVGTGVGFLSVAAANIWPRASIVGIDIWEPSLRRAREHVATASLEARIALRTQDACAVEDVDAFDCLWLPTMFLSEAVIADCLPALYRATKPGGWIVFGRLSPLSDALAQAVNQLRTMRAGGVEISPARAIELLESAGFADVHIAEKRGPSPLELVIGRKG